MNAFKFSILFSLLVLWSGCHKTPDYQAQLAKELASGVEQNELFLGFSLGMTNDAFYERCWEMNKQGLLIHGSENSSVMYELVNNELQHPAEMDFYPNFHEGKVGEMLVEFRYKGWSAWNKELQADKLVKDVYQYLKKQHGEFFLAELADGKVLCNLDGSRRITIKRLMDNSKIQVLYSDMRINEAMQEAKALRKKNAPNRRVPAWATPGVGKK